MSFIRSYMALTGLTHRAPPRVIRQSAVLRKFSTTSSRFATQGYGDGEGDPRGERPQEQGSSNQTKQDGEHPGPEPPAEGQGTGAGPTKGGSGKKPEGASAQSGGSRSKEAAETGSSPTAGSVGGGGKNSNPKKNGASPRIHDKAQPGEDISAEKQAEVEKHNREFEQGHDRDQPAAEDEVDKKFWKGNYHTSRIEQG